MVYLVFILIALSPHYSSPQSSGDTDSVTVYKDEIFLELDTQSIHIRNISSAYNPVNDHVYVFFDINSDSTLWEFKPNGSVSVLDTLSFPGIIKMMPMDITHSGESLWLWEQGLGKVFEYSFLDSSLRQIDHTRVQDLMFGHGSIITKDERILALGGYGLWEFRNYLLEFTPDNGEWNKIETFGESPVTPYTYNFLGYLESKNSLVYIFVPLSALEQITNNQDARTFEPFFEIYVLDLENNRWTYKSSTYPSETDLAFSQRPRNRATHSIDESRGVFVFNGKLTLNTDTYELFYISHPSIEDMRKTNFYYSKNSDRWIVIGRDDDLSRNHIIVRSFPASEAQLTPIEEELPAFTVWLGWFLGGFVSLALVFLGAYRWKNKSDEEEASSPKKIVFTDKNGELSVAIEGETMNLSDTILKEFFTVVYDMKKQEKSEILMSEFDNMIFNEHHSQPHRSKVKKKIFELVNNKFDKPFITIDVYPLDKRYKMISINLNAVKIDSTPIAHSN